MLTIEIKAVPCDETPEDYASLVGAAPGFAKQVRQEMVTAEEPWGWCDVDVIATFKAGDVTATGRSTLCSCSYASKLEFVTSYDYFEDMVQRAVSYVVMNLQNKVKS